MATQLPPGLEIHQLITDEGLKKKLYEFVDNFDEDHQPLQRKTRQYGYEYNYRANPRKLKKLNIPPQLLCIADTIYKYKLIGQKPNQIIINKYEPGQGIAAHVDNQTYFTGDIATLSLGSEYIMTFRSLVDKSIHYDVLLPVGSLAVMKDDAIDKWTHEIVNRRTDTINGNTIKRGTRISITFRTVKDDRQGR